MPLGGEVKLLPSCRVIQAGFSLLVLAQTTSYFVQGKQYAGYPSCSPLILFYSGADSTVRIWDVGQRACVSNTNTGAQVWAVDWQPLAADQTRVGKSFISGGDDNRVTWYKAAGSS